MLGLGRESFVWHASREGVLVLVGGPSLKEAQALESASCFVVHLPTPCTAVLSWPGVPRVAASI